MLFSFVLQALEAEGKLNTVLDEMEEVREKLKDSTDKIDSVKFL